MWGRALALWDLTRSLGRQCQNGVDCRTPSGCHRIAWWGRNNHTFGVEGGENSAVNRQKQEPEAQKTEGTCAGEC